MEGPKEDCVEECKSFPVRWTRTFAQLLHTDKSHSLPPSALRNTMCRPQAFQDPQVGIQHIYPIRWLVTSITLLVSSGGTIRAH